MSSRFEQSIQLTCPAKVNLALSVGAPNEDGMHPIASWMVAVTFGDTMRVARAEKTSFDITFAEDAPKKQEVDWPLEKDLAFRAHKLMQDKTGRSLDVAVTITKRIPAGAGLGGGSSDAAGMMVAVNRLFELKIPREQLMQWSAALGSDIAFLVAALEGQPSAIVSGLGETITPAPLAEPIHLVLMFPPFGCPTGPVYKAFDELHAGNQDKAADIDRVQALTANNPLPPDAPFNDLAEPACIVQPQLREWQGNIQGVMQQAVHITGSGSTMFVVASSEIESGLKLPAVMTRTM